MTTTTTMTASPPPRPAAAARIPADIEAPDRLAFGLTGRQLAIAAATAIAAWTLFSLLAAIVGPVAGVVAATPVALVGVALLAGRRDGLGLDQLVWAAIRHARSPRRLVPAPDGLPALPAWAAQADPTPPGQRPAPLRLPTRGLDPSGLVDLGADGVALVCRATAVPLTLRTPAEQQAAVAAFARFLHAIPTSVQLLLHTERVDLAQLVAQLRDAAGGLPHPALEAAARDHAAFLADLAGEHELLRRELLLIFHDPTPASASAADASVLLRRAEEAAGLLAAAGSTLTVLDAGQAAGLLARFANPDPPSGMSPRPAGLAPPRAVIAARHRRADASPDADTGATS